jgi:CSLREA domain-containing protein
VCSDVNECLVAEGGCAPTTICTNSAGGFTCEPRVIQVNDTGDTTADDGKCTLREAILAANTDTRSGATPGECAAGYQSDTINLAAGTYAFSGATLTISSTIVIAGAGVGSTTVSGGALSVTTGDVTFKDLSVSVTTFATDATGTATFTSTTGGTSTLTATGAITNAGAIQAGKLSVSAASITNAAGATFSSTLTLALTASGTFLNNGAVDASGNLTISALAVRNETVFGDTREWYRSFNGADTNNSTNDYYSFPDDYEVQYWSKNWTLSQRYVGGVPSVLPQLTSGGTLTLESFASGTNLGSLISAPTVTLIGNGGATFSNVDMALSQQSWRQTWEIYTHWIALGPLTYDDHVRRNDDGGVLQSTAQISNFGAGVVATTLNAGGFSL